MTGFVKGQVDRKSDITLL